MSSLAIANEKLRKASEKIDNAEPVVLDSIEPGYAYAQGDVAMLCLEALPAGASKIETPEAGQVAPGNSEGARHRVCKEALADTTWYRVDDGDELSDLCFEVRTTWTLEHPKHGNVTFPPNIYRVVHQQNEQRRRVID